MGAKAELDFSCDYSHNLLTRVGIEDEQKPSRGGFSRYRWKSAARFLLTSGTRWVELMCYMMMPNLLRNHSRLPASFSKGVKSCSNAWWAGSIQESQWT